MKTVVAALVTVVLLAVVILQISEQALHSTSRPQRLPALFPPEVMERFWNYSAQNTADLTTWDEAPFSEATVAADLRKTGKLIDSLEDSWI